MKKKLFLIVTIALIVLGLTACTQQQKRAVKDVQSNLMGLERKIEVYSYDGKLIKTYEGKMDIEANENKVKFDLDGKRHIIYNAVVIVEEK